MKTTREKIHHLTYMLAEKKITLENFDRLYPPKYRIKGSKICKILSEMHIEIIKLREKINNLCEEEYGKIQIISERGNLNE